MCRWLTLLVELAFFLVATTAAPPRAAVLGLRPEQSQQNQSLDIAGKPHV